MILLQVRKEKQDRNSVEISNRSSGLPTKNGAYLHYSCYSSKRQCLKQKLVFKSVEKKVENMVD